MVELPIHTEYLQLGRDHVDLYGTRSQSSDLRPVVVDAWVHTWWYHQTTLCWHRGLVDITLNDGIEGKFMDTIIFHTQKEG